MILRQKRCRHPMQNVSRRQRPHPIQPSIGRTLFCRSKCRHRKHSTTQKPQSRQLSIRLISVSAFFSSRSQNRISVPLTLHFPLTGCKCLVLIQLASRIRYTREPSRLRCLTAPTTFCALMRFQWTNPCRSSFSSFVLYPGRRCVLSSRPLRNSICSIWP